VNVFYLSPGDHSQKLFNWNDEDSMHPQTNGHYWDAFYGGTSGGHVCSTSHLGTVHCHWGYASQLMDNDFFGETVSLLAFSGVHFQPSQTCPALISSRLFSVWYLELLYIVWPSRAVFRCSRTDTDFVSFLTDSWSSCVRQHSFLLIEWLVARGSNADLTEMWLCAPLCDTPVSSLQRHR
jgi:hypothetical protein